MSFDYVKNSFFQYRRDVSVQRSASHAVMEPNSRGASRGFTLVELMIGLVLVAILLGIGLPMFRSFILNQQLRAATTDLRIALTLVRSEAVKRNRVVTLQPFDEDEGWGGGWVIPSPPDPLADPDLPPPADLLVHRQSGDVAITPEPDVASLQFSQMGRTASEVAFTIDIGPEGNNIQGCMRVGLDGRVTSAEGACQ